MQIYPCLKACTVDNKSSMRTGHIVRTRKKQKRYDDYLKTLTVSCDFCAFSKKTQQVQQEYRHFWLAQSIFSYDIWDSSGVKEHLLIVPKKHVDSLSKFDADESKEYLDLLAEFEEKGYSIYLRSHQNITKSIPHLHTHLIKLDDKHKKALFFVRKPHIVAYF